MRWSKLKQTVENMFADGVQGRVDLFTTRYVHAHDRFGRGAIRVDGREVINMSNYNSCGDTIADGHQERFEIGVFAGYDLADAMREFLKLSIDDAIVSTNPIIRALAVLDRRTGQRRLARLDVESEQPFVRELIKFRRTISTSREV